MHSTGRGWSPCDKSCMTGWTLGKTLLPSRADRSSRVKVSSTTRAHGGITSPTVAAPRRSSPASAAEAGADDFQRFGE